MSEYNYSLHSIPAGWLLALSAHWYAASLTFSSPDLKKFDNVSPRAFLAKVQAQEKQSPVVMKFLRAEAANANGFETLGLYAAGIVMGNVAKLPTATLNKFAGLYILSRVLFNILYIQNTSSKLSGLRSITYVGGVGIIMGLFIKSAQVLNSSK